MPVNLHPVTDEQLMSYLDGELPVMAAQAVAGHLGSCRDCQALAGELQGVTRLMQNWSVPEPSPALQLPAFEQERAKRPLRWAERFSLILQRPAVVIPASLAALILLFWPRLQRVKEAEPKVGVQQELEQGLAMRDVASQSERGSTALYDLAAPPAQSRQRIAREVTPASSELQQLLVRRAQISLETDRFDFVRQQIEQIAARHQGYFESISASSTDGQTHTLDGTLRIPATQLENVLGNLRKLGRVESESQQTEDVTRGSVDREARLRNLRETEQRLKEILRARTGKLSDVLAVEEQINSIRGQIEIQEAEQRSLAGRVALASVQVKVEEVYKQRVQVDKGFGLTRFRNAAVKGYQLAVDLVTGVLIFLLTYGPVLLLLVPLMLLIFRKWKRLNRLSAKQRSGT
jgi:Domain of unknown function (DUF4349)